MVLTDIEFSPSSAEEVQAIVGIANAYRLPLWVVSRGKNLGLFCCPSSRCTISTDAYAAMVDQRLENLALS